MWWYVLLSRHRYQNEDNSPPLQSIPDGVCTSWRRYQGNSNQSSTPFLKRVGVDGWWRVYSRLLSTITVVVYYSRVE